MSTLPKRLQVMVELRYRYESVTFTTTNDTVTATFKYTSDVECCRMARGCGTIVSPYSIRFTMKEFDNLF